MRFIALLLLLVPALVCAFEPLNTDDAGTVAKDRNQIEQYFFKTASHGGGTANTVDISTPGEEYFGGGSAKAFPLTYTRGIAENTELSLGATYFASPRGNYSPASNKVIAIKWRFAEDGDGKWALAIKPTIGLPGTPQQQVHGLGLGLPSYGLNLIGSSYWDPIELHINALYTKSLYNTNYLIGLSDSPNRTNIIFLSAAPVWTVVPGFKLALDVGLTTNPPSNEQYLTNYALLAAIFSPTEDIDIGLSYMQSAENMGIVISNVGVRASRSEIGLTWRF
ncbi:hypothetical protein ICN42_07010 [Polynucleobacter sp. 71A-WALBACH]|uniref:hypothetical protein n=1 Tax=Polynucleobacter sp. 71A-WALBACH TaxID=2689097 RepID=UPI001C0BF16B|nr:hypothetical protein [Polynucleobacter sp. 71A-WALBACH]MBU3593843.1 hypothetical protein [Polynucleobacter sp. 71A-WALBACH]